MLEMALEIPLYFISILADGMSVSRCAAHPCFSFSQVCVHWYLLVWRMGSGRSRSRGGGGRGEGGKECGVGDPVGSEYGPCAVCFVVLHEIFVQPVWAVPIFPVEDSYTTERALYAVLEASFEVIGMEVACEGEGIRKNELMRPIGIRFEACGDRLEVCGLRRGRVAVRE